MTQLALALAPATLCVDQLDEPYLYHDIRRPGFTAFVTPGGDQRQISLSLNQLPAYLRKLQAGQVDALSVAEQVDGELSEMDDLGAGLGIRQAQDALGQIDVSPLQRHDLAQPTASQERRPSASCGSRWRAPRARGRPRGRSPSG